MSVPKLVSSYLDTERVESDGKTLTRLPMPLSLLDGPQLAVHRCLLSHWNDETGQCNPSHNTISAETRFSIPTVKRALAGLRERGIWSWQVTATSPGRGRATNAYRLNEQALNPISWSLDQEIKESRRSDQGIKDGDLQLKEPRPMAQEAADQEIAPTYEHQREPESKQKRDEHLPFSKNQDGRSSAPLAVLPATRKQALHRQVERDADRRELATLRHQLPTSRHPEQTERSIETLERELGLISDDPAVASSLASWAGWVGDQIASERFEAVAA